MFYYQETILRTNSLKCFTHLDAQGEVVRVHIHDTSQGTLLSSGQPQLCIEKRTNKTNSKRKKQGIKFTH